MDSAILLELIKQRHELVLMKINSKENRDIINAEIKKLTKLVESVIYE